MKRLLFALGMACIACGKGPAAAPARSDGLEIDYRVESTRPSADFELSVRPKGLTRLTLRKPWRGEPSGAVGFFALKPTPEQLSAVETAVREHSLLERHDEAGFTREGSGSLKLSRGAERAEISLTAKDEGADALRFLLAGLVDAARRRPLAALEVASRARLDGPNAAVDLALVQLGTKPLELAVLEPSLPEGSLVVRVVFERAGRLADERFLSREDLRRLVQRKKLPAGWHTLGPGEKLWVALPLVPLPPSPSELAVRVEVTVLARAAGGEARLMASSAPSPLEPETERQE